MALNVDTLPREPEQFQAYLDELKDEQLTILETKLVERFNVRKDEDDPDMEHLSALRDQISSTRSESDKRKATAARARADAATKDRDAALADLAASVNGDKVPAKADDPPAGDGGGPVDQLTEVFASALQKAVLTVSPVTASGAGGADLNKHIRDMPLSAIQRQAPDPGLLPQRQETVIVASSDIPGVARNGRVDGIDQLVQLMGDRSRMLSVTRDKPNFVPVASLQRDFRYRLNLDSTPEEINEVLTAATSVEALVAAGGWCAPSEISYDFFNLVCEDGLVDLASVGILNRGGFRFPVSPTIADVFGQSGLLWSWTETQDQAAVTGTAQSGTKTCARIPCPSFSEARAACDGLCVTAGNLTDFAYPEMVANYLRIVMAARAHRTNQLVLANLASNSTAVTAATTNGDMGVSRYLSGLELQAIDYRERFRMCDDAILEVVIPRWLPGYIRADLADHAMVPDYAVTNAMIADWLNLRNLRGQFVADWQSGFTGEPIGSPAAMATAWPTTVDTLLYAPGTFVRGQALQLDLGVVRDSTLNSTNDHTAAWMEDCYAVAKVGHESRRVTVALPTPDA